MKKTINHIIEKGCISSELVVKSTRKKNTIISGYASVFGKQDKHNDIIVSGAFKNINNQKKIPLLWQHSEPIGVITLIKEDYYGLSIEAEINNNTRKGYEASELVKQGSVSALSIGFRIKSSDYDKDGFRIIDNIDLLEISIVTFPANEYAEIQHVKREFLSNEDTLNELAVLVKQIENY